MRILSIVRSVVALGAIGSLGVWMYAQVATSPRALAELVPPGALVYLEAKDFQGLLADWNRSPEKQEWINGDNYRAMLRTKLALRLSEVRSSYTLPSKAMKTETTTASPQAAANRLAQMALPDMGMVESAAGGESAVALYDIGKLEFVYVTKLVSTRLAASALWQARDQFQSRTANGQTYYTKSFDQGVTLAFGTSGDYLLVGTREDLVASSLGLIARRGGNSLARESWYASTIAKAPGAIQDLRLLVNLERVNRTPHFQSYWIQDTSIAKEFSALLSDLKLASGEWREQRILTRAQAGPDLRGQEAAAADLAQRVPPDAGFFEVATKPASGQVLTTLRERVLGLDGWNGPGEPSRTAPGQSWQSEAGSEDELERRIDQAAEQQRLGGDVVTPLLAPLAADVEAILTVDRTRQAKDGTLFRVDSAVALRRAKPWDAEQVKRALEAVVGRVSSAGGGVAWTARTGGQELGGLKPVYMAIDGNVLILSPSTDLGSAIAAVKRPTGSDAAGHYLARYSHAAEFGRYQRMMKLMDFPIVPATVRPQDREPLFFSENLANLGSVLRKLESAAIQVRDDGSQVTQTVTYRRRN